MTNEYKMFTLKSLTGIVAVITVYTNYFYSMPTSMGGGDVPYHRPGRLILGMSSFETRGKQNYSLIL